MKLYSDTLTTDDLYACLPRDVGIAEIREMRQPRKRARGWELSLEGLGGRHTRRSNSGGYGAGDRYAATWDDHGVWMAALYDRDERALFAGYYNGRLDFYLKTAHEHERRQHAARPYRSTAPWLDGVPA